MKSILKYRFIFLSVLIASVLNILPVIVFWSKAAVSRYSLAPMGIMALVILNGILACIFKNKGNFLMIRNYRWSLFSEDREYTFTDAYERQFRWMLLIYCTSIPFYVPIIFFSSSWSNTLWTLLVLLIPQGSFIAYDIKKTVDDVKASKRHRERLEQERIKQEQREELGRWK